MKYAFYVLCPGNGQQLLKFCPTAKIEFNEHKYTDPFEGRMIFHSKKAAEFFRNYINGWDIMYFTGNEIYELE